MKATVQKYRVEYRDQPGNRWACIDPAGALVGSYATEERAERERYAREIRAAGIARRAAQAVTA